MQDKESVKKGDTPAQQIQYVPVPADQFYANQTQDDEIDLAELWHMVWSGKWLIIAISVVFAVASIFFALSQPNIYKSEVLLAPSAAEQGGGLGALASQFGGLASLAGVNLSGGGGDSTTTALEVIKSRRFLGEFVSKDDVLVNLMAAKGWDAANNQVLLDNTVYDGSAWVREVVAPKQPKPSTQEAHKAFNEVLSVAQDKETGMVTIAIEHYSPYVAKQWVEWLVESINEDMRARDKAEALRSIEYLNQQIEETSLAENRNLLFQLVEEQTKTLMFAEVRDEYVFKIIDPAVVPEEKAKPKRALIVVLGTMLGGMLSVLIVLIRGFKNKSNAEVQS